MPDRDSLQPAITWDRNGKATWEQEGFTIRAEKRIDDDYEAFGDPEEDRLEEQRMLDEGELIALGIVVTASLAVTFDSGFCNNKGPIKYTRRLKLGENSLWGITVEDEDDPYLDDVARECANAAVYQAKQVLGKLREVQLPATPDE